MTIENFQSLGLHEALLQSLARMKFELPTEIQAKAIPIALSGQDLIATSQTGTGKTIAYAIPALSYLYHPAALAERRTILVLTPTRELALQACDTLKAMSERKMKLNMALLIGGQPMFKQYAQLKRNPEVIVGTPGRINDHLERGSLNLSRTGLLVLDEFDRMLDMGFEEQLETIVQRLPAHQTLMFSATMAQDIARKTQIYLKDPARVSVGSTTSPVERIKQKVVHLSESEKYRHLTQQLKENQGTSIVFVKTKRGAEALADQLYRDGHRVGSIHGDLRQSARDRVIREFRENRIEILIGTDVASRGLDIPQIECVINYDLPQRPEDYIHRIGRTGRAGAEGQAISYVTNQDRRSWQDINRLINPDKEVAGRREGQGGNRSGQKRYHSKPGAPPSRHQQKRRSGQTGRSW